MNTLEIEDRVRAATRAAADTVSPDSVPLLRLPSDRPFRARFRARAGSRSLASVWGPWLAPVAAAAAVVAVAVAMVTVGRTADHSLGGPGALPSTQPGPVKTGPPISSYVASGRVPRYYVSIQSNSNPEPGNPVRDPSYAVVRATATGAVIDTYVPADGGTVLAVTADADDRTFVLDEQPRVNLAPTAEPRTFFSLILNQYGQIMRVRKMSVYVPAGQLLTAFALSPAGTKLAIAVQPGNDKREPNLTEVKVITLATGATRTWTANGPIGFEADDATSLSWADDERTLAFNWQGNKPGVWLLNVATGGGSLLADSREAVTSPTVTPNPSASAGSASSSTTPTSGAPRAPRPFCQDDWIITPDGSTIVCGANTAINVRLRDNISSTPPISLQRGAETEFIECSAATGTVAHVLGHWTFGSVGVLWSQVLWSNASGSVLIGLIPDSGVGRVGVISGNEFTPLPMPGATMSSMASSTW